MAQIGTVKLETQNSGVVDVPVFETGDSASGIYEFVRVETASGTGFIPVTDPADATYPYLRVQSQNNGIVAVTDTASAIPDSGLTQIADHILYMDEGSGSTITDSKGSLDGSMNFSTWVTGQGGAGDAYPDWDGNDDESNHGNLIGSGAPSLTVSFWAQAPNDGSGRYICQQGAEDTGEQFILWEDGDSLIKFQYGTESVEVSPPDSNWHLYSGVYDASDDSIEFWIDDTSQGTATASPGTFDSSDDFTIGNAAALSRSWDGPIDYGVIAVGTAASDADIQDHYEQTNSLYL